MRARTLFSSLGAIVLFAPSLARAQSISPPVPFPARIVNGQDVSGTVRPTNRYPQGISYADCEADMVLHFSLIVSGFNGQFLEVWASPQSQDCKPAASRGSGGVPVCWRLVNTGDALYAPNATTIFRDIPVRNVLKYEVAGTVPNPPQIAVPLAGEDACHAQQNDAAIPLTIWFLATAPGGGDAIGNYPYNIGTDLVAPPPPTNVSLGIGDTLLLVNWNTNTDPDIAGFAAFIDPIPGQEALGPSSSDAAAQGDGSVTYQTICPDTGAPPQDGATEAGDAAPVDAGSDADAGCYQVPVQPGGSGGGAGGQGTCSSGVLSGAGSLVSDASTTTTTDSGAVVSSSGGGISNIPSGYQIGEIDDKNGSSLTVTGLKNGVQYNVVVSSLDAYQNIGPPSSEACASPAPVDDFWKKYRADGGGAGGGFCALETIGDPGASSAVAGIVALAGAAWVRRRRRR
jgi:MYXO-CTERM domain-containing protein